MKPSQSWSESRGEQNVREWWGCSRKWAMSQNPWGGSPYDSSGPQGWKLPTPPQPSWGKTTEEPEAQLMAFRDAMDPTQSPSMFWEDQVQEEEEQERCSSTEGDPKPGLSSLPLEGDSASDVSWSMRVSCNVTLTWSLKKRERRRAWRQMHH